MSSQITAAKSSWSIPKFPSISRSFVAPAAIFTVSMLLLSQFQTTGSSFNFANVSISVLAGLVGGALLGEKPAKARPSLEPTTSGYLRWMSVWLDADRRGLTGPGKSVSIFGPGKWEADNQVHCPQLAEACKMFNGSKIAIYDSNNEVLDATAHIDHRLSQKFIQETFNRNEQLAKSENFQQVQAQLSSEIEPSCSIVKKQFRMGEDRPNAEKSDDVIIATFSLMYPMIELAKSDRTGEQRIELLSQYLAQLKPGGAMYIERDCVQALLGDFENIRMALSRDSIAQENLRAQTKGKQWMRRLELVLGAKGIKVEMHELRQSLGTKGLSFQGVLQATNRITQTSDVFVFIRK